MHLHKFITSQLLVLIATLVCMNAGMAQGKKIAPSPSLYKEIAHMDSVLFEAFNTQNMRAFKSFFTEDLEWYQDNGGLIPYKAVFENFENNFRKASKLTRELVKGRDQHFQICHGLAAKKWSMENSKGNQLWSLNGGLIL